VILSVLYSFFNSSKILFIFQKLWCGFFRNQKQILYLKRKPSRLDGILEKMKKQSVFYCFLLKINLASFSKKDTNFLIFAIKKLCAFSQKSFRQRSRQVGALCRFQKPHCFEKRFRESFWIESKKTRWSRLKSEVWNFPETKTKIQRFFLFPKFFVDVEQTKLSLSQFHRNSVLCHCLTLGWFYEKR